MEKSIQELKKYNRERWNIRTVKQNKKGLYVQYGRYHILCAGKSSFAVGTNVRVNTGLRHYNLFEIKKDGRTEIWKIAENVFPSAENHFKIDSRLSKDFFQYYITFTSEEIMAKAPIQKN